MGAVLGKVILILGVCVVVVGCGPSNPSSEELMADSERRKAECEATPGCFWIGRILNPGETMKITIPFPSLEGQAI